jgi:hypothetical protein
MGASSECGKNQAQVSLLGGISRGDCTQYTACHTMRSPRQWESIEALSNMRSIPNSEK